MKSKKRHQSSSEESEESEASVKSSTSSGSDSDSSESDHRHKKKRKRDSSESQSESDDQRRIKKRKHKKKKKKHSKKKRHAKSSEESSAEEESVSEGEISSRKKRKHKRKHSKRGRSASASEAEERVERRLHSVVKEREASSEERVQPSHSYYQRDYGQSASGEDEREQEVQRFYRGSSKDCRAYQADRYQYETEHSDKYSSQRERQDKYSIDKYGKNMEYVTKDDYRRPREGEQFKRHLRSEKAPPGEYYRRDKDESYHSRGEAKDYQGRYNNYEERGDKRRVYDETRDYRERRPPPEHESYRDREYPDRKDRYQDSYPSERTRDGRDARRDRPSRTDLSSHHREQSRSRSPTDDAYKERRRAEGRGPRPDRYRDRETDRPPVKTEDRPRERKSRFEAEDDKEHTWGKTEVKKEDNDGEKEKPNFGLSGKLTADANTVNGVVIKYTEPDDAKQPKRRWRFYPFKGDKALPILYIHRQSAFLIGRDKKVADIALEHPSISKQHAALQYRATPFTRPDGTQGRRVRPYVIDLDSANGTFVNNKKIDPRRYVELLERDVVKFGFSAREYVLLHENSKDDAQDDDNQEPDAIGANVTTTARLKIEKRIKQEQVEDGE